MTIKKVYQDLLSHLYQIYEEREAANIADMVVEHITGLKKVDRLINKQFSLTERQIQLLSDYTVQLVQHKPIQYVLNETWFSGIKFHVDENVLIPRPETEELVEWIAKEASSFQSPASSLQLPNLSSATQYSPLTILDIGTGSGCIAVALKEKLSRVKMHAIDISAEALTVAKQNAATQQTEINFHLLNILDKNEWSKLPAFDIIVSNPPYVKQSEARTMQKNVLQYEPHIALFVSDEDALLFYRTIAAFGLEHLNKPGKIFFEINEALGKEVRHLLADHGYKNIEVKKDFQGKERMVKAELKV